MKRKMKSITAALCATAFMLVGTLNIFANNNELLDITETSEQEGIIDADDVEMTAYSDEMIASGTCGDNLIWEIDNNGVLTISGSGELYDYKRTADVPWRKYYDEVLSVKLDIETSSLCASEGNCAFGMLRYIRELTIPEGVVSIPESESLFPSNLKKLILPSTYTGELSNNGLIRNMTHTAIEVSEDNPVYSSIEGTLCNKDKTKLIQYTLSAVNPNYIIPDTIVDIDSAFSDVRGLKSLTISKNVQIVDIETYNSDFSNNGMGIDLMYSECEAVCVDEDNPYFCSVDGVLYNKDMTVLIWCPPEKTGECFEVPAGVEVIAPGAFANSQCQNIQISEGVAVLGGYAFFETETESITIPSSIKKVNQGCFINAYNLSKVYIGDCDAEFFERIFEGDSELKTAGTLGSGCNIEFAWTDTIPNNVFYNCTYLTSVEIPDTITSIGNAAFKGCSSLKAIEIPNSVSEIGNDAFSECRKMTDIYVDNFEGVISGAEWSAPKAKVTYQREMSVEPLSDYDYTGETQTPALTITECKSDGTIINQLTEGTDFTVAYSDNVCAGTATATIEYINKYSKLPSTSTHFTIIPKSCAGLTIMPITDQAYTGREIMPELTIINN